MTLLQGVWWGSWFAAAASVAAIVVLVVWQSIANRLTRRRATRKALLRSRLIVDWLESELPDSDKLEADDKKILVELGHEFVNTIRGVTLSRALNVLRSLGMIEFCLSELDARHQARRVHAIELLAALSGADARDDLQRKLSDASWPVRLAAAKALIRIDAMPDPERLAAALDTHRHGHSRELRTLIKDIARRDPLRLITLLDRGVNEHIRVLIIHALGRSGAYQVVASLLPYANDPSVDVRAETFRSFATLQHPLAVETIHAGLSDPAWEVRTQAAIAAGRLRVDESIDDLAALLEDPVWWARYRAAEALANLGDRGRAVLAERVATGAPSGPLAGQVLAESRPK